MLAIRLVSTGGRPRWTGRQSRSPDCGRALGTRRQRPRAGRHTTRRGPGWVGRRNTCWQGVGAAAATVAGTPSARERGSAGAEARPGDWGDSATAERATWGARSCLRTACRP